MKKALKELLAQVTVKRVGDFSEFMVVPNGVYDGFWGKNGYDNIILLGRSCEDRRWYKISEYADVFLAYHLKSFNIDIPHEYGIPRFWFGEPIHIDYSFQISSISGEGKNE